MPTYEYKCERCGRFEVEQSIKADPLTACPTCQGKVQRLISRNVGIVFKGSGFYITDNRSSSNGKASGSDSSSTTAAKESAEAS